MIISRKGNKLSLFVGLIRFNACLCCAATCFAKQLVVAVPIPTGKWYELLSRVRSITPQRKLKGLC